MTDQRLRELERRWQEAGAVVDEAAFLLERVRVGELVVDDLRRAAYCGHAGAQYACGEAMDINGENLGLWVMAYELEAPWWNRSCVVLAALTACSFATFPSDCREQAEAAIPAARGWLDCPCDEHARQARAVSESLEELRNGPWPALDAAIESANACWHEAPALCAQNAVWCVIEALAGVSVPPEGEEPSDREARLETEAGVRRRIEDECARSALLGKLR